MTLSKSIVFENFQLTYNERGFYEVEVFDNVDFLIADLKLLVNVQQENFNVKLPVLVLCREHANTNIELLKVLAKNENNPYSTADAFVIKSMSQRILANFYVKIHKPERPTKFFSSKEDAMTWLNQYL
jgi:hypothetical protein